MTWISRHYLNGSESIQTPRNHKWCRFQKHVFPAKIEWAPILFSSFLTATTPRCWIWSHNESRRGMIKKRVSSSHPLAKRRHILPLFVVRISCTAPKVCLLRRVFVDIYSTRQEPPLLPLLNPPVLHIEIVPSQHPQHLVVPLQQALPYSLQRLLII